MIFSKVAKPKAPARTIVVPSGAFSDDWGDKPADDVAIGVRLLPQRDVNAARIEAERDVSDAMNDMAVTRPRDDGTARDAVPFQADDHMSTLVETYNDSLLVQLVARACTDPNDVDVPYFGAAATDTVRVALTSDGLRRVWDEVARVHIELSPSTEPATDEQMVELATRLMEPSNRRYLGVEARRALSWCLALLPQEPDDAGAYVVRAVGRF